jgi:hypothetical protein
MTRELTRAGAVNAAQYVVLAATYHVVRVFRRPRLRRRTGVLVGLEDNAAILHHLARAVPGSISVKSNPTPFYSHTYDVDLSRLPLVLRLVVAPVTLGRLMTRVHTAIYVGGSGFLLAPDGRDREFRFLRRHGVQILCQFTGTDIRSHRLLEELSSRLDRDVITTYQGQANPGVSGVRAEEHRKALARSADRHATAIFNPPVDQASYITRETLPFLHFFPDELIGENPEKWRDLGRLKVVHAPSSPIIKGTPLVRAAVKALKEDGFDFDYVEIIGRSNSEVRRILLDAHIVLNEFYAFVPGVLGVEAMAANAVLLTSADPEIEPSLGDAAGAAWVVTPYWRIYEKLRAALADRDSLQEQADRGTAWAKENCSATACRTLLGPHLGVSGAGARRST